MPTLIGSTLSHYRILEELGRGGMGVAYRAEDVNLGRPVVLKVLPPEAAADPARRERFRREARACSVLSHPGITAVYEANETEGIYYICMEYVEGSTLRALLAARAISIAEALDWMTQVADAVAAAHAAGIVHRDLKPENIMVSPSGRAKVLDFGLASMVAPATRTLIGDLPTQIERLTSAGTRLGTVLYMSPEQARAAQVGPPSDVFSLGSVLYETIAGVPPFRGESDVAILHAIAYDNPASLRARRSETPAGVESVVRRALRKDPVDRYADAAGLRDDLLRCREAAAAVSGVHPGVIGLSAVSRPILTQGSQAVRPPLEAQPAVALHTGIPGEPPLVGRDGQMRQIASAMESAMEGIGQVILVTGEAGIGKTRLIAEAGARFEAYGAAYVAGRCLFREGGIPYHPFVEAAERLVALLGIESADDLRRYVEERMPALRGRLPILLSFLHLPGPAQGEAAQAVNKEHLLDAIAAFFVQSARERPILLHVDDIHWADEGTLDLFEYLARNFRRTRGVLVGTYRPEEARGLLSRLSSGDVYLTISLERLAPTETEQILHGTLPGARMESPFVDRLHQETAGNPFFVLEAIRLLRADGLVRRENERWVVDPRAARAAIPGRVHEVLARRIARLSAQERQILEVAACEGTTFRSATLAACLARPRYEILSALQAMEREHRLIRPEEDRYRFDHPMIREALYEAILPELRCEYHRLVAGHLIERSGGALLAELQPPSAGGGPSPQQSRSAIVLAQRRTEAASIAYQLLEAREEGRAVPYLLVAASHARALFANRDAETALNRAISILRSAAAPDAAGDPAGRARWLVKGHKDRGKLRVRLGEFEKAREDFIEMREQARLSGDTPRQVHALNLLADLCVRTGDYAAALDHARGAHDMAQGAGDRHGLASALAVMGIVHFNHGAFDQALSAHSRSIALQQSIGDHSGYADNLNKVGNIHFRQGRGEEALAAYSTALQVARQVQHRLYEAEALNNIGAVHHERGELDEALKHYEDALSLKREIGDLRAIARSLNNLGLLREARGEFTAALVAYQESLALKRELGDQAGISSSLNNLGNLYEQMGAYALALECCEESLTIKQTLGETSTIPYCQNSLGRLRLAFSAPDEAEALFREALRATREQGDRPEECRALVNLAEALLERGRLQDAMGALGEAAALAGELGLREMLVEVHYQTGIARLALGDTGGAEEALVRLREVRSKTPFAQGEVLERHLEARALSSRGNASGAASAFSAAADRAREIGLRGFEWRILADSGKAAEAREVLHMLSECIPDPDARRRFLSSPPAAALVPGPAS